MAAGNATAPGLTTDMTAPQELPGIPSIEHEIADFLDGRSNGAPLFDALYGDTLDELLPPRLTDLLKNWRVA